MTQLKTLDNTELTYKCRDLETDITDLKARTTPWGMTQQMEEIMARLDAREQELSRINRDIAAMKDKYFEVVEPEELKKLWKMSGIALKEIAAHFKIEIVQASRAVNGQTQDMVQRHKIKQFFLERISR
jgi:DNA-directed RNA polymerase specialized sigma54-like protein